MNGERLHFRGAYTIRMERKGGAFIYDVLKNRQIVACGVDLTSPSEEAVLEGIAQRFGVADDFEQSFKGEVCLHQ